MTDVNTCATCNGSGLEYDPTSTSTKKICTVCYGSGLKIDPKYIVLIDQADLDLAENKYKRREIEKVTINKRDFYVSYEQTTGEDGQADTICVWPCAWGWSGKTDGHTAYITSKFGTLSLLKIVLGFCDDLYNLASENVIYEIKNKPPK